VPAQIDPVNYDPVDRQALVEFDCLFLPLPDARAIGAGNSAEAPPADITGTQRSGNPIDVGAYKQSSGK
jgi:hypothetical protein